MADVRGAAPNVIYRYIRAGVETYSPFQSEVLSFADKGTRVTEYILNREWEIVEGERHLKEV